MRILLVSCFFPPTNIIGAVRVGKLAKYLLRQGHDVRVLTSNGVWYYPNGSAVEISEDRIVRVPVRPPLDVLRRLAGKLRGSSSGTNAGAAAVPSSSGGSPLRRTAAALINRPDAFVGWIAGATAHAEAGLADWRPQLVYGSCSPASSLFVAHGLAHRWRVPFVAEFRDLWADNADLGYPNWRRKLDDREERRLMRNAVGIVTVSEPLAAVLRDKYSVPVEIITNGFDPEDYPSGRYQPASAAPLRIAYTGKVYQGKQDPTPLFEAMKALPDVEAEFVGYHSDWLADEIRERGLGGGVRLRNLVPHAESVAIQQSADVLLLLLWTDTTQKGITTGKIFEYIGAGRPILAIGPGDDVPSRMIEENGLGVVVQTAEQVRAALENWADQKRVGGIPSPRAENILPFTREEQTRRLATFLEKVTEHRS